MIPGLESSEARDLILSLGTHHAKRRLTPTEAGELIQQSLNVGASTKQLAELLGLKDTTVLNRLRKLADLPPGSRDLIAWGRNPNTLSMSVGAEIAAAPSAARDGLIAAAQAHQLSKVEVRGVIQRMSRAGESVAEAVDSVVASRPVVERRYVLFGSVTEPKVRQRLAELDPDDRQQAYRTVLSELGLDNADGALRPSGFTLSRRDEPFPSPDELEANINHLLATNPS
jgi:hypothetical protein